MRRLPECLYFILDLDYCPQIYNNKPQGGLVQLLLSLLVKKNQRPWKGKEMQDIQFCMELFIGIQLLAAV